jgi:hypothetical protein
MDRDSFLLFDRAVLPEIVPDPHLGGPCEVGGQPHKEPLAALAFTVQNGCVWS